MTWGVTWGERQLRELAPLSVLGVAVSSFNRQGLIAAGFKENLVQVVAQGLLAGVAAIYLFARSVSLLGASRASTFPALVPAFGIVIGYLALGEVPTVYQLAGLAVVAVGFRLALKQ